jgi:curved DNA-binding protein CbpA
MLMVTVGVEPAGKRDLYDVLGVTRDADTATIRRSYLVLARLHREVLGEPAADERLREATQAYRVLSDPPSRALYDRLAYRGPGNGGFGPRHPGVGKPTASSAHLLDDELIHWVLTGKRDELEEELVGELEIGYPEAERGSRRWVSGDAQVRIPPGVSDGQHVAVAPLGDGKKAAVEIRVTPPPRHERLDRYVALIGLLAALVLLAVVLVLGF